VAGKQVQVSHGDWFQYFESARLRSSLLNYSGTECSANSAEHSIRFDGYLEEKDRILWREPCSAPVPTNRGAAQVDLLNGPTSGHQVDDQDDQRDHQQNVNQSAGYVQGETKKPQDQQDYEDCPKHIQHTFLECDCLSRESRLRRA